MLSGRLRAFLGVALACLPWLGLLAWLASLSWFLTDDAFISFRYARNLLEGHGLVFNPGERVEGYSNFLWVLELAAIWRVLGVAPEDAARWLSVGFTAGTLGALGWWVYRLPLLRNRGLVGWMALGLVCSSATFAVWTSGGGLETRQFTFFIVLAVVCLSLYRGGRAGLLAASFSLAGAALTRPEGPLIAVCCFGWFVAQRMADVKGVRVDWRGLAYLAAPFVVLVAAHFLFRYAYYGEWLPNTYYAKHVRPWYESGFRYLWGAAVDTGLYLLIPLAWVALRHRWREARDGIYGLVLLLIAVHMAYVMRVGGDHFEYRPLDFYWPLLALPVAEGIACVGSRIAAFDWRRVPRPTALNSYRLRRPGVRTCALILFIPVIFYCGAIQAVLLFEGAKVDERIKRLHIELDGGNAGWLLAAPGMPALVAVSNELRRQSAARFVALPFVEHREFANQQLRLWQPYEDMERGVIPDDALMTGGALGIRFYYLADLKVIDGYGLTDATVARNPVATPNHLRFMAHDRSPPPGYLEQRGVNFTAYRAASSESQALERGRYAVKVGPGLWLPFDSDDHKWVVASFAGQDLWAGIVFSPVIADNRFRDGESTYVGERFIGSFEDGFDGWRVNGDAVVNHGQHTAFAGQQPISGNIGLGFLTSYHPSRGDNATGGALSPEFTASAGQRLAFLIAGGAGEGVGVRLLADGDEAAVWRGWDTERFRLVVHPLADYAGKGLQLELFDDEIGGWGHIMLDHVMLIQRGEGEIRFGQ